MKYMPAKGVDCSAQGCELPVRSRGLCGRHYDAARRTDSCPDCGNPKKQGSLRCRDCYETQTTLAKAAVDKCCTRCGETKPIAEFGIRSDGHGRTKVRSKCRTCESTEARELRVAQDPEIRREAKRRQAVREAQMRLEDNDKWLRRSLLLASRRLGVDPVAVIAHYEEVGNTCDVCGHTPPITDPRVHVDHDHVTGKFRGFLCSPHNTFLGYVENFGDDIPALYSYLERTAA